MVVDFERASGPWHLEWVAIPDSFVLTVGALHQTSFALGGLVVNVDTMLDNLLSTRGLIVGEAVMMGLAPFIGRQNAHDVVYAACKESIETKHPLLAILSANTGITEKVDVTTLANLCDPRQYLGASQLMVDDVLRLSKVSPGRTVEAKLMNGHGNCHSNGVDHGLVNGAATNGNGLSNGYGLQNGT